MVWNPMRSVRRRHEKACDTISSVRAAPIRYDAGSGVEPAQLQSGEQVGDHGRGLRCAGGEAEQLFVRRGCFVETLLECLL